MRCAPDLESRLGHRFRDRSLLERALTHRSFGGTHNERLEFLGDGVLGCIVAESLYERHPEIAEGPLTRLRSALVREGALADRAREIGLATLIRLGEGERTQSGDLKASILADALEAVIGAVFLDGGYDSARRAVLAIYGNALNELDPGESLKDPKTRLQEWLQGKKHALPHYRVIEVQGAAHQQAFLVECAVPELELKAEGRGTSRQRAEQDAASELLALIGI